MFLRAATVLGLPFKGFLWFLVFTVQRASSQYCQTDVMPLTGTEFGSEFTFECVEGAYVSEVTLSSETDGFTGFILTCSDGEVSEVYGYCFCGTLFVKVDCAGGWTQLSTTPSLDTDSPANASFFCYNEGDPSGATLGPYPSEGANPDTSAEITSSSCDDGSYAVGVTVFEFLASLYGVALHCRTIDEATCPAPDGLLVPSTTGNTDDGTDASVISSPTPGPTSESPTEPTPGPTPASVSIPTPEPTSEPTAEPTREPTPTPVIIQTSEPTSEPTDEPTREPTPTPVILQTSQPTSEPTAEPTREPTPTPVIVQTSEPTSEPTAAPTAEPTPTPVSIPTPEPTHMDPIGQARPPTSSPLAIATPAAFTDDETSATTPGSLGPTMSPTSSPLPIATPATETDDDSSATTQGPVGPTMTPTSPGVPRDADDDNDDGGDDDSIWTETVTAVVSSVASAVALAFLAFVFNRLRGSRDGGGGDDDENPGNNRNGRTVTFNYFSGGRSSIGDTINNS
ncbi:unnamed protein product, partial [Ectocarpus fasciculatus]